MEEFSTDILITGGGAAGMAAALAASDGDFSVTLAEHSDTLGGVLNRCTHSGFGMGQFGEDMTGVEYAARCREALSGSKACILTGTTVLDVREDRTALLSSSGSLSKVSFRVLVLAAGAYEKPVENCIPAGTRPRGVMTAGCAQGLINEDSLDIGSHIVILGSGNVGQIMAGQLADAGKTIVAMLEKADMPGGIARNYHEYIEGRNIPLRLNSTITRIHGKGRITGVTAVDLISGEESYIECDTLITALGLIPDQTLIEGLALGDAGSRQSYPDWIITAGNCDTIYDFADAVTSDGEEAGRLALRRCLEDNRKV